MPRASLACSKAAARRSGCWPRRRLLVPSYLQLLHSPECMIKQLVSGSRKTCRCFHCSVADSSVLIAR